MKSILLSCKIESSRFVVALCKSFEPSQVERKRYEKGKIRWTNTSFRPHARQLHRHRRESNSSVAHLPLPSTLSCQFCELGAYIAYLYNRWGRHFEFCVSWLVKIVENSESLVGVAIWIWSPGDGRRVAVQEYGAEGQGCSDHRRGLRDMLWNCHPVWPPWRNGGHYGPPEARPWRGGGVVREPRHQGNFSSVLRFW